MESAASCSMMDEKQGDRDQLSPPQRSKDDVPININKAAQAQKFAVPLVERCHIFQDL